MSRSPASRPALASPSTGLLLGALALWDLRIELQLLRDHFTVSSLGAAIWNHPLAVVVLLLLPSMMVRRTRQP